MTRSERREVERLYKKMRKRGMRPDDFDVIVISAKSSTGAVVDVPLFNVDHIRSRILPEVRRSFDEYLEKTAKIQDENGSNCLSYDDFARFCAAHWLKVRDYPHPASSNKTR